MHAIWSRASQVHGPPRRACLQATNILIRRSTSGPSRKKIAIRDVFTACYTTIMATAAVLDAKNKDRCRKELDQRIADEKDGLADLMGRSASRDLARAAEPEFSVPYPTRSPFLSAIDSLGALCLKPELLERRRTKAGHRRQRCERLRRSLGLRKQSEWWKTPPKMMDVEEYLAMEESGTDFHQREPASTTHISRMAEMIDDLVDRLLSEAYRDDGTGSAPAQDSLDSGWNAIRMLRSDGYPRYGDPNLNRESSVRSRHGLNAVNRKIMADWDMSREGDPMTTGAEYYKQREHLVARLCYNLLVSPVPPGIHNYNALISGLSWIGEPRLSQAVVDSFLFKSHLKPTQMTLVSLLNHYRLKKDVVGFYGIVRRLAGHDPRGVGLCRRTHGEVASKRALWKWAQESDVAISGDFVVERPPLDKPLLEALLDGFIDLEESRSAARLLAAGMQEGWAFGTRYLPRIVWLCLSTLDYRAAQTLVEGLLYNIEKTVSFVLGDGMARPQALPNRLLQLVDLAEIRMRWGKAVAHQPFADRLNRLKRALWMTTAFYDLRHAQLCAKSAERILDLPGTFLSESYDPRMMPGTELHRRRGRSRRRFRMLAEIRIMGHRYEKHTNRVRRTLFRALPEAEQHKMRRDGRDPDDRSAASLDRILAQWSRYLTTLGSRQPITMVPAAPPAQAQTKPNSTRDAVSRRGTSDTSAAGFTGAMASF